MPKQMSNNVLKDFGTVVRTYRNQKGMSQETLAECSELHRTYISGIECGRRNLSLQSISKLADALGISISALFTHVVTGKVGSAQPKCQPLNVPPSPTSHRANVHLRRPTARARLTATASMTRKPRARRYDDGRCATCRKN